MEINIMEQVLKKYPIGETIERADGKYKVIGITGDQDKAFVDMQKIHPIERGWFGWGAPKDMHRYLEFRNPAIAFNDSCWERDD